MSAQLDDYVWYNDEKFILIDYEKGKSLIEAADFKLNNKEWITCCYRGYTAEYFIENNFLFGKKTVLKDIVNDKYQFETSKKLSLKYTGSMVIAKHNIEDDKRYFSSDFLEDYLEFDKAFELGFIDGELLEITDLCFAIEEWKKVKKELNGDNKFKKQYEIATKNVQYEYGNYKYND